MEMIPQSPARAFIVADHKVVGIALVAWELEIHSGPILSIGRLAQAERRHLASKGFPCGELCGPAHFAGEPSQSFLHKRTDWSRDNRTPALYGLIELQYRRPPTVRCRDAGSSRTWAWREYSESGAEEAGVGSWTELHLGPGASPEQKSDHTNYRNQLQCRAHRPARGRKVCQVLAVEIYQVVLPAKKTYRPAGDLPPFLP